MVQYSKILKSLMPLPQPWLLLSIYQATLNSATNHTHLNYKFIMAKALQIQKITIIVV
jgi:hypothetical protein